jgi:hypothetical protein
MHYTNQMELFCQAYVTAISAHAGYDVSETRTDDDSIDISLTAKIHGRPRIEVQLKATAQIGPVPNGTTFPFRLSVKNYDDLRPPMADLSVPRLLVVLIMPQLNQGWTSHGNYHMSMFHSAYYLNLRGMPPVASATKTVRIPWANVFNENNLQTMMRYVAVYKDLP